MLINLKYIAMSREQNAGRSHNTKIDNCFFERVVRVKIFRNNSKESKFYSGRNSEQIEFGECLLSFGAESFVFQFPIKNIQIKTYIIIIFLLFCMGVKLGRSH